MADKCGAKTRAGGRCRNAQMPNGRCKFHGGMSTGPKTIPERHHRLTHGIYAKQFSDEEVKVYGQIKLGTVEQEIRLMRIRLRRALAAEHENAGTAELDSTVERVLIGVEGSKKDTTSKVRDYSGLIDRITSRIESLERTRRELLKVDEPDDEDKPKGPIGRIVVEVVHAKSSHDHDRAAG